MPTLKVNGLDLFYQDDDFSDPWRPTETVLMLHGFARNGNFWRGWVPTLARHYRVIRPDIRGCGRSQDPGPNFVYEIDDVVSDCVGMLDALGLSAVHWVGESTGGVVGQLMAARHPDRLLSLTLVSTPSQVVTSNATVKSGGYPTPQEGIRALGLKEWWLRTRKDSNDLGDPAQGEYFANEVARTPVHCALAMWDGMHRPEVDTRPLLHLIQTPTLLLTPTASFTMTAEQQRELIGQIKNGRQKLYEGAPHGMFYLDPDRLAADTLEFLRSLAPSTPAEVPA